MKKFLFLFLFFCFYSLEPKKNFLTKFLQSGKVDYVLGGVGVVIVLGLMHLGDKNSSDGFFSENPLFYSYYSLNIS